MDPEKQNDRSTDTDTCVKCKDITVHPDNDIEGIVSKEKNNEICCMEKNKTLDVLVGYFVEHWSCWLKEKVANDDRHFTRYKCNDGSVVGNSKPSFKLVRLKEKLTSGHNKVLWDNLSDDDILPDSRDIVYDEQHGFIEIKKAGLYHIYTKWF